MRFLIMSFLAYIVYQFLKGLLSTKDEKSEQQPKILRPDAGGEELVEDPYCHTYVPISDACKMKLDGKTIYFCCKKCQEAYNAGQEKMA